MFQAECRHWVGCEFITNTKWLGSMLWLWSELFNVRGGELLMLMLSLLINPIESIQSFWAAINPAARSETKGKQTTSRWTSSSKSLSLLITSSSKGENMLWAKCQIKLACQEFEVLSLARPNQKKSRAKTNCVQARKFARASHSKQASCMQIQWLWTCWCTCCLLACWGPICIF